MTLIQIRPTPEKYTVHWKLRNGRIAILRPIMPEDEPLWVEMFRNLSEESIRYRFFEMIKEIPRDVKTRYCNNDFEKEIGIVAELNEGGHRKIIGDVRTIIEPDMKNSEIDFIVADQWQGMGLGLKLVDHMIEICRRKKLETINAIMMPDNHRAIRLMKKLGFYLKYFDDSTLMATLNLGEETKIKVRKSLSATEGFFKYYPGEAGLAHF